MVCCAVINCSNTSTKGAAVNRDISYFRFPNDPDVKNKWIEATGRKKWFPTKNSRICSIHFHEDTFTGPSKYRRVIRTAYPTIDVVVMSNHEKVQPLFSKPVIHSNTRNTVEMESSDSLFACRACLAADGRLYAISGSGLEHTLAALTGIALSTEQSFPRHLCVFCMAKLLKCAAFRDSCQQSTKLLNTLLDNGSLKMNAIEAHNRKSQHLTTQLTSNKLFQFDSGSFIDLMSLIKTENNDSSHEEAKCAEVYIESGNYAKKDSSDLDKCTSELPIENHEISGSKIVKSKTKNNECIKAEVEIENHSAHSEIDYYAESEAGNDTSDVDSDSSETLPTVRNGKRTALPLTKNNTAKRQKKYPNLQIEVDKYPTQINTNASEATTGSSNTIGIKSVGTELAFEKKNNRNTKALNKDVQKQRGKSKQTDKSVYNCDLCGKGYKNEVNFKKHKITHTDPNVSQKKVFAPLKKVDDLDFEKKYNVEIKLLSKEEQKQRIEERKNNLSAYSCDVCGKEHQQESTLTAHKTTYHDLSLPVECDVCFYRFRSQQDLRNHQLDDRHRYVFTCKECGHVTRNRVSAKEHYLRHQGQTLCCPYCDKKYARQSSYYSHIRVQHPGKYEACDECGETFKGKVGLLVHKGMRHRTNDKANEKLKCSVCEVTFLSAEALQRHVELSAGVPHAALWPCAACGDSTGSETALAAHAAEKHQHFCEECNKTFSDAASFALHVDRKHNNRRIKQIKQKQYQQQDQPKRIVCEICGKALLCMATLQYHMNGHLGLRPYQCEHCPKAFTDKTKLRYHMRIHTGEKPYQCEQCPLAFAFKGNFNRHIKSVHLRVQVECSACGKTVAAESLKSHIRAVHMNQPYVRRKRSRTKKPDLATDS